MIKSGQFSEIKELYMCHFSTKEVSVMTGHSYAVISNLFRTFKIINIHKYDRFELSSQEITYDDKAINE